MRTQVTKNGINIPPAMLEGVMEVEIKKEGNQIRVIPVPEEDPIFSLGEDPVESDVTDASVNHDKYIYTGK